MKISKKRFLEILNEEIDRAVVILREQEEEEETEEEEPEEEPEEEGDEADEGEDDADDEEADEEEADDEDTDTEEEELDVQVTPDEEVALNKSAGAQIDAYLLDFETKAIKSFEVERRNTEREEDEVEDAVYGEWYKRPLSSLMFEQDEPEEADKKLPPIDMESFTGDVARLIMNYDNLLDMEKIIANKARAFLRSKYDEEHEEKFIRILDDRFSIDLDGKSKKQEDPYPQPVAAGGAAGEGGGGGGI
jgi:hypothetical protein